MELGRILKGSRVAEIDRKCIASGIDSRWLMANAGTRVADFVLRQGSRVKGIVVCGSGNNGGDGFVAAKKLLDCGMDVHVFYISPPERFTSDSKYYFERLKESYPQKLSYLDTGNIDSRNILSSKLLESDFVIDAILGTGLHGKEVHGASREAIQLINLARETVAREKNRNLIIYSVDIPSGIDSDDGMVLGVSIKADFTITFGCKKFGLVNFPGAYYAGKVEVVDIGIPRHYYTEYEQIFEPDLEWVASKIPYRMPWTYKHRVGKLLVIAGSIGFTGAATMTCLAAMRAGAGIVTLVCSRGLNSIFEEKLTEVMTYPVGDVEDVFIHAKNIDEIAKHSESFDALAVGPGLSRNPDTLRFVKQLLRRITKPVVLDADGLCVLPDLREDIESSRLNLSNVIITPHAGELARILERDSIKLEERLDANLEAVEKYRLISVLKGARTLISGPDGTTFVNPTGDWALATAGTGDILTGIIGSLLCQGMSPLDASVCGAFIHGFASDVMTKETSKTALIATDLLEGIKKVFLEIEKMKYE
ncbi:MAG: NAD(P)H-hydrate dehydratase [Actinobacteria bacterium]|nr:NAD(P)H-hydrate dehydratase [Actinomycetota bacterium]